MSEIFYVTLTSEAQEMWMDTIISVVNQPKFIIKIGDMNYVLGNMIAKYVSSSKHYRISAGSRYFCERFFRASCSKNQQKTTRPPMPSAAPIRPRHLVSTQQGVET